MFQGMDEYLDEESSGVEENVPEVNVKTLRHVLKVPAEVCQQSVNAAP